MTPTTPAAGVSERSLRRPAQQMRSRATLERILDAAGHSFDEFGLEATTLDTVAQQAGTSIGSVYRYFRDKQALILALSERWQERAEEVFTSLYSDECLSGAPDQVIEQFIAQLEVLLTDRPGTRGLLAAAVTANATPTDELWTRHVERFIERYAPGLPPARLRAAAETYQVITFAMLVYAARAGSRMTEQLAGIRTVLVGYIRQLAFEVTSN